MSRFAETRFLLSAAAATQFPPDRGAEVAFAGRSNAGKSSAINAILSRRSLARASKTPGRTRLLNFFEVGVDRRIIDLPGYGYARVAARERLEWGPLIEALRGRRSLHGLFLIVDARRGVSAADLALVEWADPAARRIHALLTKADKLNRREAAEALRAARQALQGRASAQLFSAVGGEGLEEAQRVLAAWLAAGETTVTAATAGEVGQVADRASRDESS